MRPTATTLPFLLASTITLATPALGGEPADPAGQPPAAVAAARLAAAAVSDAIQAGAEALPPAAVPAPRLVRSAESQARLGSRDQPTASDDTNSPEIEVEVEAESAEMEDVRRAEESAHVTEGP